MAELISNSNLFGAEKSESDTGTTKVEITLLDAFDEKLSITQPACDLALELEKCEAIVIEKEQMKGEDQTVSPPAAQLPEPEPKMKWTVGAQCQAVWSEDGRVYAATIVSIEGDRCRVKFDGYGNEDDLPLSNLKNLDVIPKSSQEWKPGSRCRAMYSADGLIYPAVVLWVKGQRCRVRFDEYNNEEEMDVNSLLGPDELNGPGRVGKCGAWRSGFGASPRRRRETVDPPENRDQERERGGRERNWKDQQHNTWQPKEKNMGQSRGEKEPDEKKPADKLTNHIFTPFRTFRPFPPFPPPPNTSGDIPAFVPPPPPLWAFGGQEPSVGLDATSNMLMMWYMCGFHTGSYLAQQQFRSSSRD